jgi:hypothetical protein
MGKPGTLLPGDHCPGLMAGVFLFVQVQGDAFVVTSMTGKRDLYCVIASKLCRC